LARELLDRGQQVTVLGTDWAASRAQAQSIPFESIAPTIVSNLGGVEECFGRYVFPSYAPTFRFFDRALQRRERLVVVNWTNCASSTLMCERHGLELCRLVAAPYFLPSLVAPPQPWASQIRPGSSASQARSMLLASYAQYYAQPFILEHLNAHRRQLGLDPVASTYALSQLVDHYIGLFPEWYGGAPRDWPADFPRVGFPLPAPAGELPEVVMQHIAQHGAPIVFAPGTAAGNSERFASAATDCCEQLGVSGVVLGAVQDGYRGSDRRVLGLRHVELALLLRHAAAVVHHGGIGTTARAFEAGLPQIISPQGFDQPDNAERVVRGGVGAYLPRSALSGQSLASAIRPLLSSTKVEARARQLAALVRADRAVEKAVDCLLERFVHRLRRESGAGAPRERRHARPAGGTTDSRSTGSP
ncbi:MAG TPA: nucleotide disphospho-sugar-binding domain-containing protein, partial [Polyangiaceae bacterium]|nr:nucleotide disphospho-sugar-binding domain-containing protein [Polyangiaceae bacterium]